MIELRVRHKPGARCHPGARISRLSSLRQRTQHPRGLFVLLHALRREVRGGLAVGVAGDLDTARAVREAVSWPSRSCCTIAFQSSTPVSSGIEVNLPNWYRTHVRARRARGCVRRPGRQQSIAGCIRPRTSDAACVEHLAGDIPVEAVRLEVRRIGVGEQFREISRNDLAVLLLDADADVDGHGRLLGCYGCKRAWHVDARM